MLSFMGFVGHTPVASRSDVSAAAISTLLLAENSNRKGFAISNDSSSDLYVNLGRAATTSDFTVCIPGFDSSSGESPAFYEQPYIYTGPVYGIWTTATGTARITEIS